MRGFFGQDFGLAKAEEVGFSRLLLWWKTSHFCVVFYFPPACAYDCDDCDDCDDELARSRQGMSGQVE